MNDTMKSSVFVPAHITGFFTIEDHYIDLKKGSLGAGFLINKGVKTTIEYCNHLEINISQGNDLIIKEILKIFEVKSPLRITQDIQLPIGAGFGTSAASALSLSLALNEFLNLGYSIETCGQIAHKVEISLGGGLGDVIAQTGKGLVLRTLPGAPGIGEIKSFNEDVYVACKSFGDISTNNIITNPNYKKIISENGKDYVDLFRKDSSLDNFLKFSYEFSKKTNLITNEVKSTIDYIDSSCDILGSSMAMLGNTLFTFSKNKEDLEKLKIDWTYVGKFNNKGIIYD